MVREVTPADVEATLEDEEVTVVDIRDRAAYEQGHVPGAINVPLPELPQRVEDRDWNAEEVVCVCPIGQSSIQAARLLGSYEALDPEDVASMEGGYRAWDGDLETAEDGTADGDTTATADEGPEAPF